MSEIIGVLNHDALDQARHEAKASRREAMTLKHTHRTLKLDTATVVFAGPAAGWDGEPFAAWRGQALYHWSRVLIGRQDQTAMEWLGPWLDLPRIAREEAAWVDMWTRRVDVERLPREWIRWAMTEVQALRKVTPGTPVDNQIAAYLGDFDFFVTADKAFAECIEALPPFAPVPLAWVVTVPGGPRALEDLLQLVGDRH